MKDNRIILGAYAWIIGVGGTHHRAFGWSWFPHDLPGMPFGMEALLRVIGGTAMVASGCWAAMLSQTGDPELRRKGLRWFAAAHFLRASLFLHLQAIAIWPAAITSRIDLVIPVEFLIVLGMLSQERQSYLAHTLPDVRTRYERQIRQAGAQEERNRLARDLHDSIKQQIFVIQTAAATAQTRFDSDHTGAAQALVQIRNSARDAMTEMEVMMDQLCARCLSKMLSLCRGVEEGQCEALGHRTSAHVEFTLGELPPSESVAPGAHQTILRVAQEACANIGRHARAANVTVALGSVNGQLELRIQDDERQVSSRSMASPVMGIGIVNMRVRAIEISGRFDLE